MKGHTNITPCLFGLSATSQQQPANSTFLSEQTSTSHQPLAKRTGCQILQGLLCIAITVWGMPEKIKEIKWE
jgi:hypothetical protein